MKQKIEAELWDKMHYLFRDYNDRMVHVDLRYNFKIDFEVIKTVFLCFFEKNPVFHSSFTDNHIHPYWTVNDYNIEEAVHRFDVSEKEIEQEVESFLLQYIPPDAKLQMQVGVFYYGKKTALCIVENHMCMDGGDFNYVLRAICKNYNDYKDKKISPVDFKSGSRSYTRVYDDFTAADKRAAQNLYRNVNSADSHGFPFTPDNIRDKSFIARRKFEPSLFDKIHASGKIRGATINDMILTTYFYSLYELAGYDVSESCSISCAIDLRRHIKDNTKGGVTNHTAWMQCAVPERGSDIFKTLEYVVESSNKFKKDKFMGLHGLPLLSFGYRALPHAASEEIVKIGYSNPLLAMSNIGAIPVDKLALSGVEPFDGFMSGAVKYKPYALLTVTSMRKEITLSMCVRGNENDKKIVECFFDLMDKNMRTLGG